MLAYITNIYYRNTTYPILWPIADSQVRQNRYEPYHLYILYCYIERFVFNKSLILLEILFPSVYKDLPTLTAVIAL